MSRTRLLRPGDYVDGARVVSTTVRPVRQACLIAEDDPGIAAQFAESRSLAWGGHIGYVLPYSRSEGLRKPWRRLLDLLDPDEVYALGMSDEPVVSPGVVSMNGPHEESAESLPYRLSKDLGRMVYTRDRPRELLIRGSALMHSVLNAVGEDLKPPDSKGFVVVPKLSQESSFRLALVARYGSVNDAELEDALNRMYSHWYGFNLDLSKSVRVEEVSVTGDLLWVLSGDVGGLLDDDAHEHALTLPDLTLWGLQITGRPRQRRSQNPADSRTWHRLKPMVVTGSADSVEDFALFWNLRSEYFPAKPFPMWIPIELLEDAEAPEAIEMALERSPRVVGEASPQMDDIVITSASMDATELGDRLGGRFPEARIEADDLIGLFTATCEYRYVTEKLPAHFDRGRASIQPPRPEELKNSLIPQIDHVAYEIGVDGMWLPQGKAMARHLGWPEFQSRDNISNRGNLRRVKQFNKEFSETDLIDLRTPDGWTLLSSVFEDRGYDVAPTAKSRTALGQLTLLGGVENLMVAASSKVHGLLKDLSMGRGEEDRAFVSDRRTVPIDRFDYEWGREIGRDLLRWLIERRLLFRGAIIKCRRCELRRWYEVDRIGETWRCDGCKEDMPIPLHPQATTWQYKINELYAHGHDQGTLTPLLTLYAMHVAWGSSPFNGGLGVYPGVELKAKEGADVPFKDKEIDLVAMRGGDLILAECKESARPLSDSAEAATFARQLGDLVVLADHLGASQILAAASTAFPENRDLLLAKVPSPPSVDIFWLDNHDLLDPNIFAHPLSHPTATGERAGKPEGWDTDFLDWARQSVTNRGA